MAVEISVALTLSKTTKGTYVYANAEKGLSGIYVPRDLFPKGQEAPGVLFMRLTDTEA